MRWRVLAADAADINPISPDTEAGPNFRDNATNSVEQEVAVETWVDHVLDLLSRGANQQEIVAKLAHDGCPDPEGVYQRALEHQSSQANEFDPEVTEPTVAPEAESVDFNIPPPGVATAAVGEYELVDKTDNDQHDTGTKEEMEADAAARNSEEGGSRWVVKPLGWSERNYKGSSLDALPNVGSIGAQGIDALKQKLMAAESAGDTVTAQQLREQIRNMWRGYTGRVRVANFEGTFRAMDFDQWGRLVVAVDAPTGPLELNGDKAEPVSDTSDEVSEIQRFIDSIPEVDANDIGSVQDRISKLQEARSMVVAALGRADDADMGHLIKMRTACAGAIKTLISAADGIVTAPERDYLDGQQGYERAAVVAANGSVGGFDSADLDGVVAAMTSDSASYDVVKEASEGAAILVAELPELMVRDAAAVRDLAEATAMEKTAAISGEGQATLISQFCDAVEKYRVARARTLNTSQKTASADAHVDNDGPADGLFL